MNARFFGEDDSREGRIDATSRLSARYMTTLEYATLLAMQGLMANPEFAEYDPEDIASIALDQAKDVIARLVDGPEADA
jgi:hypothetical protein